MRKENDKKKGVDIIDVGGESTRPGYTLLSDDEKYHVLFLLLKI